MKKLYLVGKYFTRVKKHTKVGFQFIFFIVIYIRSEEKHIKVDLE